MFKPARRTIRALLIGALLLAASAVVVPAQAGPVAVVIRALPGTEAVAARAVERLGGTVGPTIAIIDGFAATVPASALDAIRATPVVVSVTPDAALTLMDADDDDQSAPSNPGAWYNVARTVGANDAWQSGVTGRGIDIALIDSGVLPVNGLTYPGKIVNGPDLSFESQADNLRYMDTYGHGTHMAGIIAGRDDSVRSPRDASRDSYVGIAPEARLINIKVANARGATDVSQVLAAIDWVVQHRNTDGFNIRVMNLAFGTDSTQDRRLDPLSYAVEVAWRKGIAVVVAAGNDGRATVGLANPARNPFVIAVGADDSKGTRSTSDDAIPGWSSRGDGIRNPDVVAPGKSLIGLRAPGTYIDQENPGARVNDRHFLGSGTSQAAAVVSGAAALLLQQRPSLTPDQLKSILTSTASSIPATPAALQGSGLVNVSAAGRARPSADAQSWPLSTGTGTLEGARGSAHVMDENGVVLEGEQDIFGNTWDGTTWSAGAWNGTTWSGGQWLGTTWSGQCLCVQTWAGMGWSGTTWSGTTWSGTTWSGTTWSGTTWSGTTWSGTTWSGATWSGTTWSGTTWSGTTWSGTTWSSAAWE